MPKSKVTLSFLSLTGFVLTTGLVFLFQNCGNVNLNGIEEAPPIIVTEDTLPEQPETPGDLGGEKPQYDCVTNDSVPDGHDGLTMANRKTIARIWSNAMPLTTVDATRWTGLFGTFVGPGQIVRGDGSILILNNPGPEAEGYGFPGTGGAWKEMNFEVGKFMALKFRVPNDQSWIGVQLALALSNANGGRGAAYSFSVSKCPGQFRNVDGAPPIRSHCGRFLEGVEAMMFFVIEDPTRPYTGDRCALTAGESYYFNLIPVNAEIPGNLDPARAAELTGFPDFVNLHYSRPPSSVSSEYP